MNVNSKFFGPNRASTCVVFICCTVFQVIPASGAGNRFAAEGARLSAAIERNLIEKNICRADATDCSKQIRLYGGHGNKVNYSIYAPDKKALAATIAFVVENGMEITGGVPISVSVYPRSRESYGNMFFSPHPTISLEISK
jgi:hypothetical protein